MRAPKSVRQAETTETAALKQKAKEALFDKSLSDEQADAVIDECNRALTDAGMPSGGQVQKRAEFRASFPGFIG